MTTESTIKVSEAIVLKPGDRALISWPDDHLTSEHAQTIRDSLTERFPGVEFTIITGRVEAVMPS